jgi:hypothetical protein
MPPHQLQSASANRRTRQESRRTHLRRGHPATMTVPRGNGQADDREVQKSIRRLSGVLGH